MNPFNEIIPAVLFDRITQVSAQSRFTFSQTHRHGGKGNASQYPKGQMLPAVLHWYSALGFAESQTASNSLRPPTHIPTKERENTEQQMHNLTSVSYEIH